jgi:nucleotide-binding universal stress UspA family protein
MTEVNSWNTIPAKILLPIDFSSSSHAAIEHSAVLAQQFHAEIILLHIISETVNADESRAVAEKHLATSVASLAAKDIKATICIEEDTDVAGAILDVIEREHVDLVVVSTHGTTGWHPLIFGSIAEKLVKLVPVPLLLLRTAKPESSARVSSGRLMEWW